MHYRPRFSAAVALAFGAIAALGDWPQWRGPNRDGHSREPLPGKFPETPTRLWKIPVGHAYASPVTTAGHLIFVDDVAGKETAHDLDPATGTSRWRVTVGDSYTDEFEPGPRCTPLIDGDRVYTQTCRGEFHCLSLADGATLWRFNFGDYGAVWSENSGGGPGAASRRGNAGSGVIVDDEIIVQIGSPAGACLGAFDKKTGKLRWKSQNDLTCYSSLVVGALGGTLQAVTATCEGLLSVRPDTGTELWRVRFKTGANRNTLTPVLGENTVFFASYTTGLRATRVRQGPEQVFAEEAWFNPQLKLHLATPVLVGGYLFGQGPARNYICVSAADGRQVWSQAGFGEVASTITDGQRLLVLSDAGEALLADASADGWKELGRFQACGKTYSHPAYAGGVMYVRDSRELSAWKLR